VMAVKPVVRTSPAGFVLLTSTAAILSCLSLAADERPTVAAQRNSQADAVRQCQFIEDTLIPRLVMGVRRVSENIDALAVRAESAPGGPVVAEIPLFRPYYVVDSRTDSRKEKWFLVQDGYATGMTIGWVAARQVEPFRSRYAYTFAHSHPDHVVEFHDAPKDSYERLLSRMKGDPTASEEAVLVRERHADTPWNPVTIEDPVPFMELRLPSDTVEQEYPDTTPTNRFGVHRENRLIHMGAICGGPADMTRLASLQKENQLQAGLETLFVVDETESMRPFFSGVADFIQSAGSAAAEQGENVRLAVSYYADGPPEARVTASELQPLKDDLTTESVASDVRNHRDKLPQGEYANAPERMLEGLRDAIVKAGFKRGSNAFVAVVGDTGHEPAEEEMKKGLIKEVASLIKQHGLHVFFAHVGRRERASEKLFKEDADSVRKAAQLLGVAPESIVYQTANASTLADELGKAQEQAAQARRERSRLISRIESRHPHTEPGPKLLKLMESEGISRGTFDEQHLQYYMTSSGWLFRPDAPDGEGELSPQLRELFFLAPPERQAIRKMLSRLEEGLAEGDALDHHDAVETLASELASASANAALYGKVMERWQEIPSETRSLGVFLNDVFGIRLKTALPYAADGLMQQPATSDQIQSILERTRRLTNAITSTGAAGFWFDASLVP
jgi:hypothetical protein